MTLNSFSEAFEKTKAGKGSLKMRLAHWSKYFWLKFNILMKKVKWQLRIYMYKVVLGTFHGYQLKSNCFRINGKLLIKKNLLEIMLRKLIVKYFALGYITQIFGKEINMLRGATPLSIFLSLSAIGGILEIDYLRYIGLFFFGESVYFGFIYFRNSVNSIKWNELDDVQKRIYYDKGVDFIDTLKANEGYSLNAEKVCSSPIYLIINFICWIVPPIIAMIV